MIILITNLMWTFIYIIAVYDSMQVLKHILYFYILFG